MADKFPIYWRSISTIAMLLTILSLQACKVEEKNGAATPDRAVEQYLLALEKRDTALLRRLAPEQAVVGSEIKAKISKLGGHKINNSQISYTKYKPTFWNARIRGFFVDGAGIKRKFDDSIEIEYQSKGQVKLYGGRWYLLLGNRS